MYFSLFWNRAELWKVQLINRMWNVMRNHVLILFLWSFTYYLLANDNFQKTDNFDWNCRCLENCCRITIDSTKTFTEKQLGRDSTLYFTSYLSTALSKILPHLKTRKILKNCRYFYVRRRFVKSRNVTKIVEVFSFVIYVTRFERKTYKVI